MTGFKRDCFLACGLQRRSGCSGLRSELVLDSALFPPQQLLFAPLITLPSLPVLLAAVASCYRVRAQRWAD